MSSALTKLALALAAALAMAGPAAARQNWALLIGASRYDSLDPRYWLKGPPNDIALVQTYLETNQMVPFAPDHVMVLADDLPGHDRPTLAAIRAAFADLAAKARQGDFVYLHFSGHGSQAPAKDPSTELDGLDELFLPSDIGDWSDSSGVVRNALVDDEIGAMLDAIRARGADIWVVFDSCHSGTVTREAPTGDDGVALRQLLPSVLGVPEERLEEAASNSRGLADPRDRPPPMITIADEPGKGRLVAFFAAQSDETTPEKNMPRGKAGRKPQGVFTWTIFQALAEHPGITYRQLGQEVLRAYAVGNLTRTTPMFAGDLDAVVFGADPGRRVAQWPAEVTGDRVTLAAGRLHGITPGARLAVMASPADPTDRALGFVTVATVDTFSAQAVAADGFDMAEVPKGAFLRQTDDQVDFTLTVALPDGDTAAARMMRQAAAAMTDRRLIFVAPGAEADLRLAVFPDSPRPDAIRILPATGVLDGAGLETTPSVSTAGKTAEDLTRILADNFTRIARAVNLMRVGAASGDGPDVTAELQRARFDAATGAVDDSTRALLDTANVPRLIPDDVVGMRLENTGDGPVDFNILYVGSDYSISFMGNGRLLPGSVLDQDFLRVTDDSFGRDRMVVVLSPAAPQSAVEDLSFLEQDAVPTSRGTSSDLENLLAEAGFGETSRSAVSLGPKKTTRGPTILQFELDTVPASR